MTSWTDTAGGTDWFNAIHTVPGDNSSPFLTNWSSSPTSTPIYPVDGDSVSIGANYTITNAFGVYLNSDPFYAGLSVGSGSNVTAASGVSLNLSNAGTITLSNGGAIALGALDLRGANVQLLGGTTGNIFFNSAAGISNPGGIGFGGFAGATATINNSETITGDFEVTAPSSLLTFVNTGIVNANNTNDAITFGAHAFGLGAITVTNNNLIEASGSGSNVYFSETLVDNTGGGTLSANGTSSLISFSGGTVVGGTLHTNQSSSLLVGNNNSGAGNTIFDGTNTAVHVDGNITFGGFLGPNGTLEMRGAVSLSATSTIADDNSQVIIRGNGVTFASGSQVGAATRGSIVGNSATDTLQNSGTIHGLQNITGLTVTNTSTGVINADGLSGIAIGGFSGYGSTTINNSGIIKSTTSAGLSINSNTTLNNAQPGTILASGLGSHVDIATGAADTNNGALVASGGTLNIHDSVVGTGTALINSGGSMIFGGSFQQSLLFMGAGTLSLEETDAGTISGFGTGDTIDLSYVTYNATNQAVWQPGTVMLAIEDSANDVITGIHLAGKYSASEFILGQSGSETSITFNPNAIPSSDFDGSGTSDVLWFNGTSGAVGDWLMNNGTPTWHGIGQASASVSVKGFGDFNGNGTSDILWENPTNGVVGDWLMSNNVPAWQQIGQGSTTMNIAGVGDFYGNGTDDILWQNPTNNLVGEWQMNNNVPTWQLVGQGSTTMNIAGIGDFNGDGKSDILWENPTNNLVGMWGMNGSAPTWSLVSQGSTTMQIVGVGDFTGNGTDDVLWENPTNGTVGFWGMNNGQATSWNVVGTANTAYSVAGVADYYGNGTSDILWHNGTSGDTGIWAMNNGQASWHDLGASSTAFNVVKP